MYTNILAAIDSTEKGNEVIAAVQDLAAATGAKVHVLHVEASEIIPAPGLVARVDLEDDRGARQVVDDALAKLAAAGVTADGDVVESLRDEVPSVLIRTATEKGSDLIVVGPEHHSLLDRILHGSVSHEVALRSPSSVLLVL